MLRDHLRSFWRGVVNNKLATFINVGGLALGLAVFFALTFYVHREFSWDAHWEDADRMHAVLGTRESAEGFTIAMQEVVPYALKSALQSRNPDAFEAYATVLNVQTTVNVDDNDYTGRIVTFAEPDLLELLQLESVAGSLEDVFEDPRSIALNTRVATVMFGTASPLGRRLSISSVETGQIDYVVRAVFEVPEPSWFAGMNFLALLDLTTLPVRGVGSDLWQAEPGRNALWVFHDFKLRAGIDPVWLESDLRAFMNDNGIQRSAREQTHYSFPLMQDKHLMPTRLDSGNAVQRLWVYAGVGTLVLLISGCNFVMMATLRSVDRMREVGIRKTIGGEAAQLMRQYLLDVFLQALLAAIMALALLELSLPPIRALLSLPLDIQLLTWPKLAACLGIVAAFTLMSGIYPAYLMSRGKPASLLRNGGVTAVFDGNLLRKMLVGTQFTIVIVLLLASVVATRQIDYTRNRDRGYNLEDVMGLRIYDISLFTRLPALLTEFNRVPGLAGAAAGNVAPGLMPVTPPTRMMATGADGSVSEASLQNSWTSADYFRVMSVPVLAGREFSADLEGAQANAPSAWTRILLNESAARALGFQSPELAVGSLVQTEVIDANGQARQLDRRVIGVVADTQFSSVMLPPTPQWYNFFPTSGPFLAIRFEPGADRSAVLAELETAWSRVMGDAPFQPLAPELLEQNQLAREQLEARIVIGSSLLAIAIALLGLYALVAATVVTRVKEIGVRKVMGADRVRIISLLLWQFSKPIVVANLFAWPLGLWGIAQWLERFPYRLDVGVIAWSALGASVAALLIAWLTVGLIAAKAASAKPVLALRYE